MRTYLVFLFVLTPFYTLANSKKAGEDFGRVGREFAIEKLKTFSAKDLLPPDAEPFDASYASEALLKGKTSDSATFQYLLSDEVRRNQAENSRLSRNESFFEHADKFINGTPLLEPTPLQRTFSYETCQEAGSPYVISLIRNLHVDLESTVKETKICTGHQHQGSCPRNRAKEWVKSRNAALAADPTIEQYKASITGGKSCSHSTNTLTTWKHKDNVDSCDAFRIEKETTTLEGEERWTYENEALLSQAMGPHCTLIEQICLDSSPKQIQGQQVQRQCWKEKLNFICHYPETQQCSLLRGKNCQETSRKCLQEGRDGCALWEITYKCLTALSTSPGPEIFGLGEDTWQVDYEPNQMLPEVYAKLALFEELKKDLEKESIFDASALQIFKGKSMSCSKNVADKVMYDCCFAFGGLANDLKLSQCSEEELSLGEMRQKGLCHYVGKKDHKFLDLWKSSDEHVFCCFNSKLARVFHEEARNQLQRDWGTAKHPECRGFTLDEFTEVDISRVNLSQVFDQSPQVMEERLQQKLEALQPRLQERLRRENGI